MVCRHLLLIVVLCALVGLMLWQPTLRPSAATPTATSTVTETSAPTRPTVPETIPPTREATATPTNTPTPTPRPAMLPLITKELRHIENGDLETGSFWPGWQMDGVLDRAVVMTMPHGGAYCILLGNPAYDTWGGCPVGAASVYQIVDVPREGRPVLRAWYRIHSYDTSQFDYFAIDVAQWPGGTSERLWQDGGYYWSPGVIWTSGWREAMITLDNYRGKTIEVRFSNVMTNEDGYYNTWTFVDDVSLSSE